MAKLSGKLSVLMPAYNEETIIYENALEAARQISPLADDYELLVIDDGSSDRTKAEIERAAAENPKIRCISYQPNQGKGGALREGTAHATGDHIAFCDADLDLAPEQLADFIDRMQRENADVVIGSKMHPESKVDYPAIRRVYSWGYYILLLILFRLNVRDTQTGLKLFKAEVLKPVMRQILVKRFAFDIEVLAIINARGSRLPAPAHRARAVPCPDDCHDTYKGVRLCLPQSVLLCPHTMPSARLNWRCAASVCRRLLTKSKFWSLMAAAPMLPVRLPGSMVL